MAFRSTRDHMEFDIAGSAIDQTRTKIAVGLCHALPTPTSLGGRGGGERGLVVGEALPQSTTADCVDIRIAAGLNRPALDSASPVADRTAPKLELAGDNDDLFIFGFGLCFDSLSRA